MIHVYCAFSQVSVRFLDYGNVEEVPLEWVAELPPEFTEYPFQVSE